MVLVGERALALCARQDGRYDVFHSQWAGGWTALRSALVDAGDSERALGRHSWQWQTVGTRARIIERIDYLSTAAVYEVTVDGIRVLLPIWLGYDLLTGSGDAAPVERGILVPVRTLRGAVRVRIGTRWLRTATARGIETGVLTRRSAVKLLVLFHLPSAGNVPSSVASILGDREEDR